MSHNTLCVYNYTRYTAKCDFCLSSGKGEGIQNERPKPGVCQKEEQVPPSVQQAKGVEEWNKGTMETTQNTREAKEKQAIVYFFLSRGSADEIMGSRYSVHSGEISLKECQ